MEDSTQEYVLASLCRRALAQQNGGSQPASGGVSLQTARRMCTWRNAPHRQNAQLPRVPKTRLESESFFLDRNPVNVGIYPWKVISP